MKPLYANLGMVFYKNRIAVAEVRGKSSHAVPKTAEFMLPAAHADLTDLPQQSDSFKAFLASSGFREKRAIVGLDASRVFTILLDLPASKDQILNEEMIRLQLERKTQLDMDETVFSCACRGDKVFVAAALKRQVEQIQSFLLGSGIRPVCITPASLAVAESDRMQSGCRVLEYPESAELLFWQQGQITSIQNLTNDGLTDLLPRIRRQVDRYALMRNCSSLASSLWLSRTSSLQSKDAAARLLEKPELRMLPAASPAELTTLYAQFMAQKAMQGQTPQINLLSSMQPPRKMVASPKWLSRIGIIAAGAVLMILLFALEWHMDQAKISRCKQQLDSIGDNVTAAQTMIDRTTYARQWFVREPRYLEMLMELTNRFPDDGGVWLNSLAVDASWNQIITGKARGEQAVLDVVDNLKSSPRFQNVKILYIRQAGKNSREETFAISFNYERES